MRDLIGAIKESKYFDISSMAFGYKLKSRLDRDDVEAAFRVLSEELEAFHDAKIRDDAEENSQVLEAAELSIDVITADRIYVHVGPTGTISTSHLEAISSAVVTAFGVKLVDIDYFDSQLILYSHIENTSDPVLGLKLDGGESLTSHFSIGGGQNGLPAGLINNRWTYRGSLADEIPVQLIVDNDVDTDDKLQHVFVFCGIALRGPYTAKGTVVGLLMDCADRASNFWRSEVIPLINQLDSSILNHVQAETKK